MNDLRDIALAVAASAGALEAGHAVQLPYDEGRWVRAMAGAAGLVVCAVQKCVGLTPDEVAQRREALARLAPGCRWGAGVVGSVDAQGCEVLSVVAAPSLDAEGFEALLDDLFNRLAACSPEPDPSALLPGVAA